MQEDYVRNAKLVRVVDGDTIVLDIDLGFGVWRLGKKVRILGINCPEMHGPSAVAGLAAKVYTLDWFNSHGGVLVIRTVLGHSEEDAFGRVLAEIHSGGASLGEDLLASGNAVVFRE